MIRGVLLGAVLLVALPALAGPGEAAEAQPTDSLERGVLGFADHLFEQREYYRAIGEYERYLFSCPDCSNRDYAQRRIADAYRAGGALARAAALYKTLAESTGDASVGVEARWLRAETLSEAKRYVDAASAFDEFVAANPDAERVGEARWEALWSELRGGDVVGARARAEAYHAGQDRAAQVRQLVTELEGYEGLPTRSPVLAGVLSGLLPGAGQAYCGRWRDAFSSLLMNALWTTAAVIAYRQGEQAVAVVIGLGEVFWYGGNVYGAITAAHRYNGVQRLLFMEDLESRYLPARAALSIPIWTVRF